MKSLKVSAIVAIVFSAAPLPALAMDTLTDNSLSHVSAQDGVSIGADLGNRFIVADPNVNLNRDSLQSIVQVALDRLNTQPTLAPAKLLHWHVIITR